MDIYFRNKIEAMITTLMLRADISLLLLAINDIAMLPQGLAPSFGFDGHRRTDKD